MKRPFLILMLIIFVTPVITGCGGKLMNTTAELEDAIRGMAIKTVEMFGDTANGQAAAGAQGVNPKIRAAVGIEYFVEVGYDGVAGQLSSSAHGTMNRDLPPHVQQAILNIYQSASLSESEKLAAIERLMKQLATQPNPTDAPVDPGAP